MASRKLLVEIVGDSRSLERSFKRSTRDAKTFSAQMDRSAKSVQGFSRGLVGGFAGAAAFNVVIAGLKDVIGLAAESQQVLGQTSVAVKSAGISWDDYGKSIETAINTQSKFGFDDEALLRSFSLFIRTSGSVEEALRRNQIAMDVARARFIDLESAANLVNKAALGQAGALRRVGIDARNGASGVQLLTQLERQFGGAAQAASTDAATAMDRFRVSVENAKEAIGSSLLPMLTTLTNDITNVINGIGGIRDAVASLDGLAASIGINIDVGISGSDLALSTLSKFVPGVEQIGQIVGALRQREQENRPPPLVRGERGGPSVARDRPTAAVPTTRPGPSRALRNQWFDARVTREVYRLQGLTNAKQIAGLRVLAKQLQARIKITKDATRRNKLEDDLIGINREILSLQESGAAASRASADASRESAQAAAEAARARKETQLFAMLGLGAGGAAPIPGVAALRKRFARIADSLRGTALEAKLRTRMTRLAKVLTDPLLQAFPEVRRVIEQELAKIDALLGKGEQRRKMHFRKANIDAMLAGLGLSPDEIRALKDRLAAVDSRGKVPGGTGPSAFGMPLGGTTINIGTVVTPDSDKFIRDMQKRAKRSRPQQRGVRPGVNLGGA